MSEFVVGGVVGDQESFLVACSGASDDSGSSDGCLDDWDERAQFAFKDTVEVVGASSCDEAVSVGEFGEDADVIGVLVLYSVGHAIIIEQQLPNPYKRINFKQSSDHLWHPT